jgi:hypothetical protein
MSCGYWASILPTLLPYGSAPNLPGTVAILRAFTDFTQCLLVYSYRLILHPLATYPGPTVAKVSDWYGAFQSMKMRLHLATFDDHETYGMVESIAEPVVALIGIFRFSIPPRTKQAGVQLFDSIPRQVGELVLLSDEMKSKQE